MVDSEKVRNLIAENVPAAVAAALKCDARSVDDPSLDSLVKCPTVTHYRTTGEYDGDMALFFDADHRQRVVDLFVKRVLATDDPPPGGVDSLCLEISNIVLGRLTGALSERGLELRMNDPGVALSGADFHRDNPMDTLSDGDFHVVELAVDGEVVGEVTLLAKLSVSSGIGGAEKKSVLIVDDSEAMRSFLEKVFREHGYEIAGVATDGVEAIEKFEATNPDIVTLDIIMPKMKGTEALERILEKNPDAKVVMASSVSDAKTVMRCLKIGAKRYIIKPYDDKAVIGAVEKALGL